MTRMTNGDAIELLKSIKEKIHGGDEGFDEKRKEAIDRAIEALEETKPSGTYQCFHCGAKAVFWNADFTLEEMGYEGEGIVNCCTCGNCGAEIEYRVRFDEEESDEVSEEQMQDV